MHNKNTCRIMFHVCIETLLQITIECTMFTTITTTSLASLVLTFLSPGSFKTRAQLSTHPLRLLLSTVHPPWPLWNAGNSLNSLIQLLLGWLYCLSLSNWLYIYVVAWDSALIDSTFTISKAVPTSPCRLSVWSKTPFKKPPSPGPRVW